MGHIVSQIGLNKYYYDLQIVQRAIPSKLFARFNCSVPDTYVEANLSSYSINTDIMSKVLVRNLDIGPAHPRKVLDI